MDKKSGEELASTLDANPSEPIQPAAPAAEPAPAPAAPAAPVAAAPAPKKKKTGLIVGVTLGALAVAGGGTAAAILLLNNKSAGPADPTSAIADTISDALTGNIKNVAFDGTAKLGFSAQGASGSVNFTFGGEISDKNGKANLNVDASAMGMNIKASADAVLKDSKAYFKLEGIKDTLEKTGLSMMLGSNVTKSIKSIDGTWYMLPATVSSLAPTLNLGGNSKCTLDIEKLIEDRDGLSKLYKDNSFIKAEKYTGNDVEKKKSDLYTISLDKTALVGFANAMQEKYTSGECGKSVTESDINNVDMSGIKLLAEFDNNSISRIYASADKDGNSLVADVNLSTPSSVNIEAPSGAKSAEELGEAISPLIKTFFGGSMGGFGGGSFGGSQFDDDDDDLTDNCIKGGSLSTNCIDVDDDDNDDDDSDTFDYDSLKDLLDSYDTSDYDTSELDDIIKQLEGYEDLFKNLDYDDLRSLEDLDVDSIDSDDLNSALEKLKSLQ